MPSKQLCTLLSLVTEMSWPQQTLAQFFASPGQCVSSSPCRVPEQRRKPVAGRLTAWLLRHYRFYLPTFPSRLTAATSSSHSRPFMSLLTHVNNISLHSQEHTQLKKGGKCTCDILRFSRMDRSEGRCATVDEPIRSAGMSR